MRTLAHGARSMGPGASSRRHEPSESGRPFRHRLIRTSVGNAAAAAAEGNTE